MIPATTGRTPRTQFDFDLTCTPNWLEGLTLQMKVFSVRNSQDVTEFNSQSTRTAQQIDPDFLNELNYQTPCSLGFTVRYEF